MDKKRHERNILELVYEESEYAEIVEAERPDFCIRHKDESTHFGVEVTELHISESYARLHHIPGYFGDIISHDDYRHRADKTVLAPVEVEIQSSAGESKGKSVALIQKLPKVEEYVGMIINVITAKDSKFSGYDKTLDHINLIIYDAVRTLLPIPVDQFYDHFYTRALKDALYASSFREVFFVTILDGNRRVYVPLKMLLLLAEFHLFGKVLFDYPWETSGDELADTLGKVPSASAFMLIYAKYLRSKTDKVHIRDHDGVVEVILGNCGMVLEPGEAIHDYADHPRPRDARLVRAEEVTQFFSTDEFCHKEREILAGNAFVTEIAFDVRADFWF